MCGRFAQYQSRDVYYLPLTVRFRTVWPSTPNTGYRKGGDE